MRSTHMIQMAGSGGGDQVPVRNGLITEYKFDENKNLIRWSNMMNSATSKVRATVTVNVGVAPDGKTTADAIVEDATAGANHHVYFSFGAHPHQQLVYSVYLKAGNRSWAQLEMVSSDTATYKSAYFDLTNGVIGTTTADTVANMTSVGSGWYRCSIAIYTYAGTGANYSYIFIAEGDGDRTFNGDPVTYPVGVYAWGAQCEIIPQGTKNLIRASERFDRWFKYQSTITTDATTAPDGTSTADQLIEAATTDGHRIYLGYPSTVSVVYTFSLYAKANTRDFVVLDPFYSFWSQPCWFNLATGAVGTKTNAGMTASIESVGGGWYRCSLRFSGGQNASNETPVIAIAKADNEISYAGDVSKSIYIWGAQIEISSTATTYERMPSNVTATPSTLIQTFDKQFIVDYSKPRKNRILWNQANGGEDGTTVGFTKYAGNPSSITSSTDQAYQGTRSIKHKNDHSGTQDLNTYLPNVRCYPGEKITCSAHFRTEAATRKIYVYCLFYKEGVYVSSLPALTRGDAYNDRWTRFVYPNITVPDGVDSLTMECKCYNIAAGESFYLDGLQLEYGSSVTDWESPPNIGFLGSTINADTNDPTINANGIGVATDDYVRMSPVLAGLTQFTVMHVLRTTTKVAHGGITGSTLTAASGDIYLSTLDSSSGGGDSDSIRSYVAGNTGAGLDYTTISGRLSPRFEVLTFKFVGGAGLTGKRNLGSWTAPSGTAVASVNSDTTKMWYLGRHANFYRTGDDAYFVIYNRALSDGEIAKNYAFFKTYLAKNRGIALP